VNPWKPMNDSPFSAANCPLIVTRVVSLVVPSNVT
jgi:hypothetical protein